MQATGLRGFNLSIPQARLWSFQQESPAYRLQYSVRLEGVLHVSVLLQALQHLADQHSIYRTEFHTIPGLDYPLQVIAEQVAVRCEVIDLGALSLTDQREQLQACFVAAQSLAFDMAQPELFRVKLFRVTQQEHVLLMSLPALWADDATLIQGIAEISRVYTARLHHEDLDEEPLQYVDVVSWLDELLQEEDEEKQHQYWHKLDLSHLETVSLPLAEKGTQATVSLPAGYPGSRFQPRTFELTVEREPVIALQNQVQQHQVSVSGWLLACWQVLLWRLTEQANLLVGVACDGRIDEDLITLPGLYTRFVPISTVLAEHLPFEQVAAVVQAQLEQAQEEQLYFIWNDRSGSVCSEQGVRLYFPLCFAYEVCPSHFQAEQLTLTLDQRYSCTEPFSLRLNVLHSEGRLRLAFDYDPQCLGLEQIQRIAAVFHTLLQGTVMQPGATLGLLPLLSITEQEQMAQMACAPQVPLAEKVLHQRFEEYVVRQPEQLAIICGSEQDIYQYTYQELNQRANQLAHVLRTRGVGPGVQVGLCTMRSVDMLVCLLAILKAGGAYVPLDPESPPERLAYQLRDIQTPFLLTHRVALSYLSAWEGELLCLEEIQDELAQAPQTNPVLLTIPQDLMYLIYTSGSTGLPKGVMISQQSVVNYSQALCDLLGSQPGWHYATVSTLAADLGNTAIFCALASGGCLQILNYATVTTSESFVRWATKHPIDVLKIVPSHLSALLASEQASALLPRRALVLGGEVLPLALLSRLSELRANCAIYNHYGPTETTIGAIVHAPASPQEYETQYAQNDRIPLGRPISNSEAYICNRSMQIAPVGVIGELYLGGVGLAFGYLNQPEQTSASFVPHPFSDQAGARLYRTGDLARYTAVGKIEFWGRRDTQVKLRGYRVELAEIEAVLRRHPAIWDAAVVLRTDLQEGSLVGYIVSGSQGVPEFEQLRAFIGTYLPEYMIPTYFVLLDVLPLTVNGKVDRAQLPAPEQYRDMEQTSLALPRSPIEEILAEIWKELLAIPAISVHANFFELGGHSLLATRLIARIQTLLHVEVPLRSLFDAPTIATLAQQIERGLSGTQELEIPPLVAASRAQRLPLSFAQQRLWFLDQLDPGSTAYLLPRSRRLKGALHMEALDRSLQALIWRHESLRTTFVLQDEQPVQVIHPPRRFLLPVVDLSELPLEEQSALARQLAEQEASRPCDLTRGPLLRTFLLRQAFDEHILLLTLHHIISDGWSNDVFLRELTSFYQSFVSNQPLQLPDLPVQYADFAVWQRQWLQGAVLETQLAYWKQQLADVQSLELPTDHPRPPVQSYRGAFQSIHLEPVLRTELLALAQREGVTLFMLLLAAFQVLLARYSNQTDISVGTPIANRMRAELEGLIGFFVNTLVLRTDLAGNPSFLEILSRVREVALSAYAHQDIPFEHLVEALQPERDLSRSPFFQVMFSMQQIADTQDGLEHFWMGGLSIEQHTTKFDLSLHVISSSYGLHCGIEYSTDCFEAATIRRFLEHWQILLQGIAASPLDRLSELPLLSVSERREILQDWNATLDTSTPVCGLHALIERTAEHLADAVAIVSEDQQFTYTALMQRASRLAVYLQGLGVGPESLVGVCMERSLELVVALLGILKAGGAYVPLDPAYPAERLAFIQEDAGISLLLTLSRVSTQMSMQPVTTVCLDTEWEKIRHYTSGQPLEPVDADTLAYVIYTSGSTGQPKGVLIPHRAIVNHCLAVASRYGLHPHKRILEFAPLGFDQAAEEIFPTLASGAVLVLRTDDVLDSFERFRSFVEREQLQVLNLPAVFWYEWVSDLIDTGTTLPACVEVVVVGGEKILSERFGIWERYTRGQVRWFNAYGPTETTITSTLYEPAAQQSNQTSLSVPIGRPITNMSTYVLDDSLQVVPVGVSGELYIGGIGVARGYLQRPELTAERFLPDPYGKFPGARIYRTGDVVRYLPAGNLEFMGRSDAQVKVRGYRIEPGEIEAVLGEHPSVHECQVLAREDSRGSKQLVAYVAVGPDTSLPVDELRSYLQKRLPDYMVPAFFLLLDALPLTPGGKVDRQALLSLDVEVGSATGKNVAQSPLEELLLDIWRSVLGRQQIHTHDNFFTLGGHSLLATQLISRVRAILKAEIPLRSLFEAPTIASFVRQVEQTLRGGLHSEIPPLLPVARTQDLPLSFAQQRIWFLDQLESESSAYLIPSALRLDGMLDIVALERSLQAMAQRHESLRTTFSMRGDQPVQVIHPAGRFLLPILDVGGVEADLREREALRLVAQEAALPCDLTRGPLFRARLVRLEAGAHILLLTMHHIVSDIWSDEVFGREIVTLYQAFAAGEDSPLRPLPVQYADYALWQRQWLQGAVLEEQLAYWRHQLAEVPPLDLPADHPRPPVLTYRGARQSMVLSPHLSESLVVLSQRESVTLFMLLLSAFQVLLARTANQTDISVGTPIANRTRPELEGLIGFFVNTLVLRTNLEGNPTFREVLRRVREVALGAYTHQDIPFEYLVESLQAERDPSRTPLFQTVFSLQQVPELVGTQWQNPEGLALRSLHTDHVTTKFDLTMIAVNSAQGLYCGVEYNTDLFEYETIERLLAHWQILLEGIVANPASRLGDLPLLTTEEQHRLLVEWNNTSTLFPAQASLADLFEQQVVQTPDSIALVTGADGEQHLSYQRLNGQANQLARFLRRQGVGAETPVGLYQARSLDLLVSLLAIVKAGGVYVPLDAAAPVERQAYVLAETGMGWLLVDGSTEQASRAHSEQVRIVEVDRERARWQEESEENLGERIEAEQLGYVMYTSGSTGRPKGVAVTQRNIVRLVRESTYVRLDRKEILLLLASVAFDASTFEIWGALLNGARLQIMPPEIPTLAELRAQIQRGGISTLWLTAGLFHQLVETHVDALQGVGQVLAGGDVLDVALVRKVQQSCESQVINGYGPTEATTFSCCYAVPREGEMGESIPIGGPISNASCYVLDQWGELVPPGGVGELYIGGAGLARGYWGRAELTAERFVPNRWREGERLYRTGDEVRWRGEGTLEFVGRSDRQVKLRGYRIELGEIEGVLGEVPGVQQGVVLLRQDERGEKQLVAYVVYQVGELPLSAHELRHFLQEKLPGYMIPSAIVVLESFPLTINGKLDRHALPAPDLADEAVGQTMTGARTPIEEIIAEIWCDVLGQEDISIHANFFELGGHSLLATRLISHLRVLLQIDIPLRTLFEAPTIAGMAEHVEPALHGGQKLSIPPLLPVPRTQNLPLSFAQQRLWFLHQLQPDLMAYLIPDAQRLEGTLSVEALEQAFQVLIARHEILRTTFEVHNEQPVQVIHHASRFYLPVIDLSMLSHDRREREARRLADEQVQGVYHLDRGPLLRGWLLRLQMQESVLLLMMHHIISDGWSTNIFYRELTTLYQAFVAGQSSPLAPLPIQYVDYAVWQRQWLQGAVSAVQLEYWKQQLAGSVPLDLPLDSPRPPRQTFNGAHLSRQLPRALQQKLIALSQREGVTMFMLLLAAYQVLLARYTGQTDISVGTAIANRTRPELEGLIGFFVNTLALRTDLSGDPSFTTLLHRVREVALGAYAHQDVSFEQLVEILQPERDLSRSPLFQVTFGYQKLVKNAERPAGLQLSDLLVEYTSTKFELSFGVVEGVQGLHCGVTYNTDLFTAETIERLLEHWGILLEGIVADPQCRLSALPLLSQQEQELLQDWNATRQTLPDARSLPALIAAQVARTPEAIALVEQEQQMSYAALLHEAQRLAWLLREAGVQPGSGVVLCLERGIQAAIGLLAIWWSGAYVVTLDAGSPEERLRWQVQDSEAGAIVTREGLRDVLTSEGIGVPPVLTVEQLWFRLQQEAVPELEGGAWPWDAAAYLLYTSGSTGRPKGVVVPQRAIVNRLWWGVQDTRLQPGDRMLQVASWSFDIALWELCSSWLVGATTVLVEAQGVQESRRLRQQVQQEAITVLHLVPSLLGPFLEEEELDQCVNLRLLLCGGEAVSRELVRRVFGRLGVEVHQYYGPTEAAINVTRWRGSAEDGVEEMSLGQPIANAEVWVVDEQGEEVPIGVRGELLIGGENLGWGYWGRPEQTAEKFIPDRRSGRVGARVYRTGDRGRWIKTSRGQGALEYGGRTDGQVKIRGQRIELGEIEAMLQEHPEVRESVVLAQEEANGEWRLIGYVVGPGVGEAGVSQEIRRYVQERLPEVLVPTRIVVLERWPLTTTGKIDRRQLQELKEEEALRDEEQEEGAVEQWTPVEELLGQLWGEVLGIERVGRDEDFFALGGHSLLATRLVGRIQRVLQAPVQVTDLFEAPTLREMAERIEYALRGDEQWEAPVLKRQEHDGSIPLSFAQQRLWFLDQLEPGSLVYLIPRALHLHASLDSNVLERSLRALVERQQSLRTTFRLQNGKPVQVIHPADTFRLPILDLQAIAQPERELEVRRVVEQEAKQAFDLERGPLFRAYLLCLAHEEYVLLLTMHHIISDGWSNALFERELMTLYRAFAVGEPSPLEPLPIQYTDFARWQRDWLQGEVLESQLNYWKTQLHDPLPVLQLPVDRERPPVQTFQGAAFPFTLSEELSLALQKFARQEGVTDFMALLTAFQIVLHYYTGQEDLIIGTDVANRNRLETEGLIGFFVNQLVLRTDLSGNPDFQELLRRVRTVALGAYLHQDMPFDRLVEVLKPERNLSHNPLFQVKFTLQNTATREPAAQTLSRLAASSIITEHNTAKFDVLISMIERGNRFSGWLEYNTDIFAERRMQRLIQHFIYVLERMVAQPACQLVVSKEMLVALDKEEAQQRALELQHVGLSKLSKIRRRTNQAERQ